MSKAEISGYLHAEGRRIVNGNGDEVILRGWGAGNWTNPEGFMIGIGNAYMQDSLAPGLTLPARFATGRGLDRTVRELCGSEYAKSFWPRWHEAQLGEADIRAMAEWGYNSVRLPITSWALLPDEPGLRFNEEGFRMLDRVLNWCEQYGLYAILDLHGAPGGQSGLACDDGLDNIPRLFMEPETRERALALWEEIARRYRDRWIVGGYELLNEPIAAPRWHYLMPELERFYDDAIERIRSVDKRHMIILEGATFCTNVDIFHRNYDSECRNWAVSVHLYSYSPEIRELYKFLEVSYRLNVPLWIGEGRAKDEDMAVFYALAEAHGVGFNLWSWKSVANDEGTGAAAYELPEGFEAVIRYATEDGPRPGFEAAQRLFDAMLERMRYENCRVNERAHRYCLRLPGIAIPGAGYDGDEGSFSGGWRLGNPLGYRTEDGTHLVLRDGVRVPDSIPLPGASPVKRDPLNMLLLQLDEGAFASYSVNRIEQLCPVTVVARAPKGGVLRISDGDQTAEINVSAGMEQRELPALTLSLGGRKTIKCEAARGVIQLIELCVG